jgi:hypothetical protein
VLGRVSPAAVVSSEAMIQRGPVLRGGKAALSVRNVSMTLQHHSS